jgi:hypothetical protein
MQGDKRVLASNSYFAALLCVEPRSIQRWIKDLEARGYLIVSLVTFDAYFTFKINCISLFPGCFLTAYPGRSAA